MTTTLPPPNNSSINAAQTANAASSTSGTTSPSAAGSAQPTARSYASATKKNYTPPPIASSSSIAAVGGPQQPQHGKTSSVSPVNGKGVPPAVPTMSAPTIVNSNGAQGHGDHSRKASMTISAAGTSINNTNGGPVGSAGRPNIAFGSMNASGSPAVAHSTPQQAQSSTLAPASNPRVVSPVTSPSPIPQASSGGRPPSGLSSQGNAPIFGSQGGEFMDSSARSMSTPQGPPQATHLRRESSQSAHGDSPMNAMRNYPPNAGRGRGNFTPGFQPHSSPNPRFSQPINSRPQVPGQFQTQMGNPNSPYRGVRTPQMNPAQMQQQQGYVNQHMQQPGFAYQQQYVAQQPTQGPYGLTQHYDPTYGYYQPYNMHAGGMPFPHNQPASPRPGYAPPQHGAFMGAQYSHGQNMQRSASQQSQQHIERPSSTLNQPQTPALSAANHAHTPSQSSASPAPSSTNYTKPPSKSKGIVIKNQDGEVITFSKKTASPAPPTQPSSGPIVVSSTPTPPPRAPSAAEPHHARNESTAKSDAEKKSEFREQVKKQLEAEKVEERRRREAKEADEKSANDKVEAEAKAAREKQEAQVKATQEKEAADKAAAEAAKAKDEEDAKKKAAEEKAKLDEEEEQERIIREMEEAERLEEEREHAFKEKQRKQKEEQAKIDAAKKDEELKRLEREAEELEEKKASGAKSSDEDAAALFASLKKPQLGPGANAASESGTSTPTSTTDMPPPAPATTQPKASSTTKQKPTALKLETSKSVEPAQPTAGMESLKSARFLQVRNELVNYPDGVKSPNPALNQGSKTKGRQYDKDFLLQFQEVFREKPSVDWDNKLKETVGDSSDSARPQSSRTPGGMGPRGNSMRGSMGGMGGNPAMGQFTGAPGRTLPPGTTSQDRFNLSSSSGRGSMTNPLANLVRPGGAFPMGGNQMGRTTSFGGMPQGQGTPRSGSHRGSKRGGRGNDARQPSKREEEQAAKSMPLTAGLDLKPLETSRTGWKPASLVPGAASVVQPGSHMAPDMVQRKVKSNLNKMTPENFEKITGQILEIAGQSVNETDGRTLRQVIQLTFEKACDEAHWASMYAKFCKRMLETMSTDIKDDNITGKDGQPVVGGALFRKYLLNRCQEDFEKGWEADLPSKPEGEKEEQSQEVQMLSDEYYIAAAAKRKGLGLIQFIGELYKLNMLTLRIMHECVLRLLNFEGLPDESSIESLVKLIRTIGATMHASEQGDNMINVYFDRISKIEKMDGLNSRLRFMLLDLIDLRKAGWKSKDDQKGPKTITEIHAEAAAAQAAQEQERLRQNTRGGNRMPMGRGDARSASGHMPPPDYSRNTVASDDLRKLSKNASSRTSSQSPGTFGPSSLFAGRASSGRRGLGPGSALGRGDESGASSRTATPPTKEKEPATHTNSFSALASLQAQEEESTEVASNPSSPSVAKTQPARVQEVEADKPSES